MVKQTCILGILHFSLPLIYVVTHKIRLYSAEHNT